MSSDRLTIEIRCIHGVCHVRVDGEDRASFKYAAQVSAYIKEVLQSRGMI